MEDKGLLIKNALIVTPEFDLAEGSVAVKDGNIVSVGEISSGFAPGRVIDGAGKLLLTGLVNCHTHSYMSLFRGYADDLPFDDWLFRRIMPKEDLLTPEDAYWCTLLAAVEMIKSGTTCFLDMHMFRGSCMEAAAASGMRAVLARGIVGEDERDEGALRRLDDLFYETEMSKSYGGRISTMIAPHSIYTCGEGLLRHIGDIAVSRGMRVHIHLSETEREVADCRGRHGVTPVGYLQNNGLFRAPTVAAHCVWLEDDDIDILSDGGVSAVTCPCSNMKLGNGFAPVPELIGRGVNVALGTDGAASNNTMNMFAEMRALSLIHKGLKCDPSVMPAGAVLGAATAAGAAALGIKTGRIEPGYAADFVLVDLERANLQPNNDPVSDMVYAAGGAEVDTVVIDGKVVLDAGEFCELDEKRIFMRVKEIKERIF